MTNVYHINSQTTKQQLNNSLRRSLAKAEALAVLATLVDFETVYEEIIDNYFWALSDLIQESKKLFEQISN